MDKNQIALTRMFDKMLENIKGKDYTYDIVSFINTVVDKANVSIPFHKYDEQLNAIMLGCYTMDIQFPYYIDVNLIKRLADKDSGNASIAHETIVTINHIVEDIENRANNLLIPKLIEDGYIRLYEADEGLSTELFANLMDDAILFKEKCSNEHNSVAMGYIASPLGRSILQKHRMESDYYIEPQPRDLKDGTTETMNGLPFFTMSQIPQGKIGLVAICSGYETVSAQDKHLPWVKEIMSAWF